MSRSELQGAVSRMRSVDMSYMPVYPGGQVAFDRDCQILARAYLTCPPASESVNTKLLAACELVAEAFAKPEMECIEQTDRLLRLDDAIVAARAQAEDGAKLVDEHWLQTVLSWKAIGSCWCPTIPNRTTSGAIVYWHSPTRELRIAGVWSRPEATRGDVRRLLTALGIEKR